MNKDDMIAKKLFELSEKNIRLWTEDGKLRFKAAAGTLTAEDKDFLKENKQAVIDCLLNDVIKIEHDEEHQDEPFALTEIQQAYVLGRNKAFQYGGTACHIYLEYEYDELDPERAQAAWNRLIRLHPMLRVTMDTDGYQQINEDLPEFRIKVFDMRGLSEDETALRRREIKLSMDHSVYDTSVWPMYSIAVSRGNDSDIMHFSMEFAVADWTSIWNLLYGFEQLYFHPDTELKAPRITFRDYLAAEKKLRSGSRFFRDREYWLKRIDTLPKAPELPVNSSSDNDNVRFSRRNIKLSKQQWDSFCDIARGLGVTPSTAVMTAYGAVLARWSRNKSFCLNLSILNRLPLHEEVNDIVGDFTAGSLLEMSVQPHESFLDTALRTNRRLFDDLDHRLFTGVNVLRELQKQNGGSTLMPYVFTGAIGLIPTERSSLTGRMTENGISQTAQVFMDCQAMDSAEGLNINLDTRDGVFKENTVNDISDALKDLLTGLSADKTLWTRPDHEIPLPAYQRRMREQVNGTKKQQPRYLLHEKVISAVRSAPDALAVADSETEWNGAELYSHICGISAVLKENGTKKGDRVVIALPKSRWQLAACLAVLSLGAAYVPIDISCGEKRCENILGKVKESCVICHSGYSTEVSDEHKKVYIDKISPCTEPACECGISDEDTAYIIFTSGSTGEPKGVEISHRAAVNTIEAVNDLYDINSSDRVFSISRLNFDLSVYDMFGVIARGGAVVIPDHEQYKNPAHWADMMRRYSVTVWNSVPALMQMLTIYYQYNEGVPSAPLRLAMLSGDWIPVDLPDEIGKIFGGVKVVSLGGATEGGIWSIYHEYIPSDRELPSIPYGKPLPNQGFMIKDELMQDCPDTVQGELYITGDSLAKGYFAAEDLTAAAFIEKDGIRMYKTGDTGCYHADGNIEFTGRNDDQVKLRGHRIELGETETVMKKVFGLENIRCMIHGSDSDKKLAAVIVSDRDITESEAAEKLAPWLPDYMIPTVIARTDNIPLTQNGKTDSKALGTIIDRHISRNGSAVSSRAELSDTEKKVSGIICDALDIPYIDPDRDLYEEGANSLVLARTAGRLRTDIDPDITFDDYLVHLLNTPNVRAVAAFIDSHGKRYDEDTPGNDAADTARFISRGSDRLSVIFADGLSEELMTGLESAGNDILFITDTADTADIASKAEKYAHVSVSGQDSRIKDILELASALVEKGTVPENVNILETDTESDADFDLMYAGNIRFGLTVSDVSEADEIRSIMEEFCMGDVMIEECRNADAAVGFMLDKQTIYDEEN